MYGRRPDRGNRSASLISKSKSKQNHVALFLALHAVAMCMGALGLTSQICQRGANPDVTSTN